jgi:hypothetical protein
MDSTPNRRRILELAGTGTALSLAGCSALQNAPDSGTEPQESTEPQATTGAQETADEPTDSPTTTETPGESTADGDATVTVAVRADQQALRQRQQEIQAAVEAGNISRTEAQQQARRAQFELRTQAAAAFRQRAGSTAGLSVESSIGQFGVLLVSGSASALIDSLSYAEVNALLDAATFQRVKSQVQQQTGTATASN